jgi:IS1 family transposase
MSNNLPMEKQVAIISNLAEDMSIRGIERVTGVHRDTIMRLGVRVGESCSRLLDKTMHNLNSENIQVDEIWGFIGKKQKNVTEDDDQTKGDVWTFIAVDADTKIVPCYKVGKRTLSHATDFICDLAGRLNSRIQLSSDGLAAYTEAVEVGFGADVDYGQTIKTYKNEGLYPEGKYSPGNVTSSRKTVIMGMPDVSKISTSYIEAQNLTVRMHVRRLTRLTNAFSKKLDNFKAAMGLHFAYQNFVKRHTSLRMTPAMAAGLTPSFWSVRELIERAESV